MLECGLRLGAVSEALGSAKANARLAGVEGYRGWVKQQWVTFLKYLTLDCDDWLAGSRSIGIYVLRFLF